MTRCLLFFSLVAFALPGFAAAQADAFPDARRALKSALNKRDAAAVEQSLTALRDLQSLDAFRHVLGVMSKRAGLLARRRLALLECGDAILEAETELAEEKAAHKRHGGGSDRKLALCEDKLSEARERSKKAAAEVRTEERINRSLRLGLGILAAALEESDRREAGRQIRRRLYGARSPEARRELLGSAIWLDDPAIREIVFRELERGDVAERVAVLVALGERGGASAVEPGLRGLVDPSWTVKAAAITLLTKVGGRESVQALIERLPHEEGRLRTDIVAALKAITGSSFHDNVHLWRDWFAANGDTIDPPVEFEIEKPRPARGKATAKGDAKQDANRGGSGFYGVQTDTKHPIFVIDLSGSMTALLKGKRPAGEAADNSAIDLSGGRRIDGVARQLLRVVRSLPSDGSFNVIVFSTDVGIWRKTMQRATHENKQALETWLLQQRPIGWTNLFGGLERAFRAAGRGSFDKSYELAADTIFLLSDGSPSRGRLVATADILREVASMNELRRVAIHTVGLGRGSRFLRALAEQNGGQAVTVK